MKKSFLGYLIRTFYDHTKEAVINVCILLIFFAVLSIPLSFVGYICDMFIHSEPELGVFGNYTLFAAIGLFICMWIITPTVLICAVVKWIKRQYKVWKLLKQAQGRIEKIFEENSL